MSADTPPDDEKVPVPFLEQITAVVLMLALGSLGWISAASYWPGLAASVSTELQIGAVLALLSAALLLVSVLALLRTRSQKE